MWASTSLSRSMPGAISVSSMPSGAQVEDGALGHEDDLLAAQRGVVAVEGDLLDLLDECGCGLRSRCAAAVADGELEATGGEAAAEDEALGRTRDVDEAAAADRAAVELADVDVARGIDLREAEEAGVEAAAVIEVELEALLDDGLGVVGEAEVAAPGRGCRR